MLTCAVKQNLQQKGLTTRDASRRCMYRVCKSRGEHGAKRRDFPNLGSFHYRSQHNTKKSWAGLLRVWLQPSFRRGEMFVFPLPYPCYTRWALGKTVQVKFLMIDTINLDMNDPGKRKTRPDSTEFSLFFCNLGFSAT